MSTEALAGTFAALGSLGKQAQESLVITPGQENPFASGQGPLAQGQLDLSATKPKVQFLTPADAKLARALQLFGGQEQFKSRFRDPIDQQVKLSKIAANLALAKKRGGGGGRFRTSVGDDDDTEI